MLGRLARYLRIVGADVEYARGVPDAAIAAQAASEHRTLLTRDEALAGRVPGSVRLRASSIEGQLREVRAARPGLSMEPRFDRCTACNGPLVARAYRPALDWPTGTPPAVRAGDREAFQCERCGHLYWEGSHTKGVAERLRRWFPGDRV